MAQLCPHAHAAVTEGLHRPGPGPAKPWLPVLARGAVRRGALAGAGADHPAGLGGLSRLGPRYRRRAGAARDGGDGHRPGCRWAAGRDPGRQGEVRPQAGAGDRAGRRRAVVDAVFRGGAAPPPARPHRRCDRFRCLAGQARGGARRRCVRLRQCGDGAGGGGRGGVAVLPPGGAASGATLPLADLRRLPAPSVGHGRWPGAGGS